MDSCILKGIFLGLAVVFSSFYGSRAILVDTIEHNDVKPDLAKIMNFVYLFIFHFTGSFIGWILLYCLVEITFNANSKLPDLITIPNSILLLFSFLGVTGHIPQSVYGFVKAFGEIAKQIAGKIKS